MHRLCAAAAKSKEKGKCAAVFLSLLHGAHGSAQDVKIIEIMAKSIQNRYMSALKGDPTQMPYSPQRAEWVAIAGLALAAASSILGGVSSAEKNAQARKELRKRENRENAWYQRSYNEDYIDTKAGQAALNEAKEYARDYTKKAEGAAAVTGGTDAATAAAKQAGNKMVADTIRNVSAQDTARKDSLDRLHQKSQDTFSKQEQAYRQQQAANIANTAAQTSNVLMQGAAMAEGGADTKAAAGLKGSSNGSTVAKPTEISGSSAENGIQTDNAYTDFMDATRLHRSY